MTDGPPAAVAIRIRGLSKRFGPVRALEGLDLDVARGEALAVFGPNGAGKTTLIRLLTLGLRPDAGSFALEGLDPRRDDRAIRERIGLISHRSLLYHDLTPAENLEFFARLYGVAAPRERAAELLDRVGLAHRAEDRVGQLSRGMQQRVSIARALVHEPSLLFLDEPFAGLDPHAARMLRGTLDRLREAGRTVLVVTHDLTQGLELSDRWLLLAGGRLRAEGRSAATDRASFEQQVFSRMTT